MFDVEIAIRRGGIGGGDFAIAIVAAVDDDMPVFLLGGRFLRTNLARGEGDRSGKGPKPWARNILNKEVQEPGSQVGSALADT